jgi:hypothetical protein
MTAVVNKGKSVLLFVNSLAAPPLLIGLQQNKKHNISQRFNHCYSRGLLLATKTVLPVPPTDRYGIGCRSITTTATANTTIDGSESSATCENYPIQDLENDTVGKRHPSTSITTIHRRRTSSRITNYSKTSEPTVPSFKEFLHRQRVIHQYRDFMKALAKIDDPIWRNQLQHDVKQGYKDHLRSTDSLANQMALKEVRCFQ